MLGPLILAGDENEWPLEVLPSPLNDPGMPQAGTPVPHAGGTPGFQGRSIGQDNQENIPLLGQQVGGSQHDLLFGKHVQDPKGVGTPQVW